jgi:hypothetical protein
MMHTPVHVLVVRQDGVGIGTKEVVVPEAEQTQDHGQVLLGRGLLQCTVCIFQPPPSRR